MKKVKLMMIVMLYACYVFASESNVSGTALLGNSSNHSGIKVSFIPMSPSAIPDSALTNADGFFSLDVENGIYNIVYSKSGYQSVGLDEVFINSDLVLEEVILSSKAFREISGAVHGMLFSDTTYIVTADIYINDGATLTIEPGTEIKFDGYYALNISGTIIAQASQQEPILFTSNDNNPSTGDWAGIIFSGSGASVLSNTILEYGGGTEYSDVPLLQISNSNLLVNGCLVKYSNEAGIKVTGGEPVVKNTEITQCEGWALRINSGSGKFYNNRIHDCGPHAAVVLRNGVVAEGNRVYNNSGVGILLPGSSSDTSIVQKNLVYGNRTGIETDYDGLASILYNTIYNNSEEGIKLSDGSIVEITGNIIFDNNYGIYYEQQVSSTASYNLIDNTINFMNPPTGIGQIITSNQNGTPSDTYYNILENPEFLSTDPGENNFLHLAELSPAIDAGRPGDLDPDSTIRDMGAFPFLSSLSTAFPAVQHRMVTAFPNPFKNEVVFKFDAFNDQEEELYIFDLLGRCVKTIRVDVKISKNVYWDTSDEKGHPVPPGAYIYRVNRFTGIIVKE